ATITDDIEHRGALGHPHRMIILARQEGDRMADANPLGALGEGAVENFRGRAVGKFPQEVVLYRPEILEADLVSQFHLGHDLLVALVLDAVIVGFWHLDFIHEPKLHGSVLLSAAHRKYRAKLARRNALFLHAIFCMCIRSSRVMPRPGA